jgi:glycosyltransferase EpsH
MLAEMYDCAKKSDLDIVGCDIRNVDENLKEIGITKVNSETQTGILTEEQHRRLITDGSNVPPKIFKRELIEKNHLAFPFKLLYEDYYFITLAFVFAKSFDIVRKPFYNYFTNTQSISRKKDTDGQVDKLQVMNLLIEKFKEIGLYEKYKEELEYLYTMFCYMNSSKMCIIAYSKPNYKALYELRKNIREQIPDYRQKKYFKNKVSKLNKFLILLNDISPRLYVFAYKIYQFIKK